MKFIDSIKDKKIRNMVVSKLSNHINANYIVPSKFPSLYRYSPLSSYIVDNLINEEITATLVSEINDIFDCKIHVSEQEQKSIAEKQLYKFKSHINSNYISNPSLDHLKTTFYNAEKQNSLLNFTMLDDLGTYVCCFSTNSESILMWSHYASSNTGICVEYDFNQWCLHDERRSIIYPIAYSNSPINLSDILIENPSETDIDISVLCAALSKSEIWNYEKEWRILLLDNFNNYEPSKRLQYKIDLKPSSIVLGYHFLKPCIYYDKDKNLIQSKDYIKNFIKLIDYALNNKIPVLYSKPYLGSYEITNVLINMDKIQVFVKNDLSIIQSNYTALHNSFVKTLNV